LEALLLGAESVEGAFAGGLRGQHQLLHVRRGERTLVGEGVLEDMDYGLLERDDLGLELVFGEAFGS